MYWSKKPFRTGLFFDKHECVGRTFRGFWCAYVSVVHVVCTTRVLELAVLCRLMVLLNLAFPGRMFGEFCCAPVSWVQSLFTRMLGPLCSTVWAADTGRPPNCPPTTGLCNSDTVSYLTLPRISLQRLLVLQAGCGTLVSNGRLFNALAGWAEG